MAAVGRVGPVGLVGRLLCRFKKQARARSNRASKRRAIAVPQGDTSRRSTLPQAASEASRVPPLAAVAANSVQCRQRREVLRAEFEFCARATRRSIPLYATKRRDKQGSNYTARLTPWERGGVRVQLNRSCANGCSAESLPQVRHPQCIPAPVPNSFFLPERS